MRRNRLAHEIRILGPGILLLPLLVVGVFDAMAGLAALAAAQPSTVDRILTSAVEMGMSLGAGLAAANLIAGERMAEMHLATPGGWRGAAIWRLGVLTAWSALLGVLVSLALRGTGTWLTGEPFLLSQLVWAAPLAWMTAFGGALALLLRSRAASAGIVTGVWLAEAVLHDSLSVTAWARPIYLLATSFDPGAPWWLANRLQLLAGAAVLAVAGWALLGDGEAFVGSGHE